MTKGRHPPRPIRRCTCERHGREYRRSCHPRRKDAQPNHPPPGHHSLAHDPSWQRAYRPAPAGFFITIHIQIDYYHTVPSPHHTPRAWQWRNGWNYRSRDCSMAEQNPTPPTSHHYPSPIPRRYAGRRSNSKPH